MISQSKATPAPETSIRIPLAAPVSVSAQKTDLPGKKILVVDDDPITVRALSLKLKSKGYQVVSARDASRALNATRTEKPDLMLLDVNLPPEVGCAAWNGFLVAEWLQRMEEGRNLPIIVMSATDSPDYRERAMAAGASAFFCKQMDNDQLFEAIESALRGCSSGGRVKPATVSVV